MATGPFPLFLRALFVIVFYACGPSSFTPTGPLVIVFYTYGPSPRLFSFLCYIDCLIMICYPCCLNIACHLDASKIVNSFDNILIKIKGNIFFCVMIVKHGKKLMNLDNTKKIKNFNKKLINKSMNIKNK